MDHQVKSFFDPKPTVPVLFVCVFIPYLTAFQVMAYVYATFLTRFFGDLIGSLNFMLSRRAVAQKKALLLGFLDVGSSLLEACKGLDDNIVPTEHQWNYFPRPAFLPTLL